MNTPTSTDDDNFKKKGQCLVPISIHLLRLQNALPLQQNNKNTKQNNPVTLYPK